MAQSGRDERGTFERGRMTVAAQLAAAVDAPIEDAVEAARHVLGMDMAYFADTRAGLQDYLAVTGDGESFGACVGSPIALEGTYCNELLAGRLDGVVRDARADSRVRDLPITEDGDIGAYIGVPVTAADGEVFGTFCCLSHQARPDLDQRDLAFIHVLARVVASQLERQRRERELHRQQLAFQTVSALLAALAARDGYTEEHSVAVVDLALAVGARLDLPADELADLEHVALLHDIGKLGVPDQILHKPGRLTENEWTVMQTHPVIGEQVVASMPGLAHLAPAVRAEHERWDGAGYPDGLAAAEIPLLSRIVLVCDAIHAMTSDRPYRPAMSLADALEELRGHRGSQFCPEVVDAALALLSP
jgi:response regulator RpfG family c-di-GMP phosphodiesterase